jgi:hypothetical protein
MASALRAGVVFSFAVTISRNETDSARAFAFLAYSCNSSVVAFVKPRQVQPATPSSFPRNARRTGKDLTQPYVYNRP